MDFDRKTNSAKVAQGTDYTKVTAATTQVKASPGRLVRIIVTAGTGTVTAYDNASGDTSGNVLWTKTTVAVGDIYYLDIPASVGIVVVAAAATTVNAVYS